MPVICTKNMKDRGMYNRQMFKIQEIDREGAKIRNKSFSMNELCKNFTLAHAVTCKYQGDKIDDRYCIWDMQRMDKKMAYTAISRTKKVGICTCKIKVGRGRSDRRESKRSELSTK